MEPGVGTEGRLFEMTAFAIVDEATLDQRWVKRLFCFVLFCLCGKILSGE